MVDGEGIEPTTTWMSTKRSTTELSVFRWEKNYTDNLRESLGLVNLLNCILTTFLRWQILEEIIIFTHGKKTPANVLQRLTLGPAHRI